MVFWICLGLVVVGLGVLLVLLVELRAKQRRLQAAVAKLQPQVKAATEIVGALQSIEPPQRPAGAGRRTGRTGAA